MLPQNYTRNAKHTLSKIGRYGHARQFKRLRRETKRLRTWLGRMVRDIERKIADNAGQQAIFADELALAHRLLRCFETTGHIVRQAFVERGYRGSRSTEGTKIYLARQRRGMTRVLRRKLKRRNAIEPVIGHIKSEGHLGRNHLKGAIGDAINALMAGAGQNLRMILKRLRLLFAWRFVIEARLSEADIQQAVLLGPCPWPAS